MLMVSLNVLIFQKLQDCNALNKQPLLLKYHSNKCLPLNWFFFKMSPLFETRIKIMVQRLLFSVDICNYLQPSIFSYSMGFQSLVLEKVFFFLASKFSKVWAHSLSLFWKSYFVETNFAKTIHLVRKSFVNARTCYQKWYCWPIWLTHY